MGFNLRGTMPNCPSDRQCLLWVQKYLKDCVCSGRDEISFAFGLISVLSWGMAEVPQIITNYKQKSTEGLSLTFLMTWIIGDLFNLVGCWLEPATLPTQLYMALLYTITTMILFWQTLYYGYICKCLKAKKRSFHLKEQSDDSSEEFQKTTLPLDATQSVNDAHDRFKKDQVDTCMPEQFSRLKRGSATSSPIPVAFPDLLYESTGRDLYYMSARSLARSHTPTAGSYLAQHRGSGRRDLGSILGQASVEDKDLLTSLVSANSTPPTKSKSSLCVVAATTFFMGMNIHLQMYNTISDISHETKQGFVIQTGRKILQEMRGATFRNSALQGELSSTLGAYLGWSMAAIYMGGRLPQIWLNIKRGTVEGLSPLMFMCALIGNATYVGSILVRSLEWTKIKPNMPWLVDAGVCVLLDCFILAQFIYFRFQKTTVRYQKGTEPDDGDGPYEATE